MNPEQVLAGITELAGARVVSELAGGPASDSYLVQRNEKQFVLRIDTEVARLFGLDRKAEAEVLEFVSQNELGPQVEFVDPARGVLVTRFVEGRVWAETDLHDPCHIGRLAELLQRLHAQEPVGRPFNLNDKVESYARIIGTADALDLAGDTQKLLRELDSPSIPPSLCHNDLVCANIVDGRELVLIDWEYAAVGDPMFDLATIAEHHQFDQNKTGGLLEAYFGELRDKDIRRLSGYRFFYKHLLMLWLMAVEQLCGLSAEQQVQLVQVQNRLNESGAP